MLLAEPSKLEINGFKITKLLVDLVQISSLKFELFTIDSNMIFLSTNVAIDVQQCVVVIS